MTFFEFYLSLSSNQGLGLVIALAIVGWTLIGCCTAFANRKK